MLGNFLTLEKTLDQLLDRPVLPGELCAESLGFPGSYYLAQNFEGDLILLIQESSTTDRPNVDLKYLRVEFGVHYLAQTPGNPLDGFFTSIKLKARFVDLSGPFCALIAGLISGMPAEPTSEEIRDFVEDFVSLFVVRPGISRERIKGLWGELAYIAQAKNTDSAVDAWHDNDWGSRDFSYPEHFIEVKTSEAQKRSHDFSLSQLDYPGKLLVVLSLLIDEDPQGVSVLDLFETIRLKSSPGKWNKLNRNFFGIVGQDLDDAKELKFAFRQSWDESKALFNGADIPKPVVPSGAPISAVKFNVTLENVPEISFVF